VDKANVDQPATVSNAQGSPLRIWDPFVRYGHWTLVFAFGIAYFAAEDWPEVHEWAGYAVLIYLVFRIVWGFIGSAHARFSDFLFGPSTAIAYLRSLLRKSAKRFLGHSPAGAMMVFALLFMLAGTTMTGVIELAQAHGEGPLSYFVRERAATVSQTAHEPESAIREIHGAFANLTLILIGLHIAGVVVASVSHKENLVIAMITGRKRV
jgi:cytochrome b